MGLKLSLYREGDFVRIVKMHGSGGFKTRLMEMGFIRGKVIKIVKYAPLEDPIELEVSGSLVSLRIEEADMIEVEKSNKEEYEND